MAITEHNASEELRVGRQAIDAAREATDAAKEKERELQLRFAPIEDQLSELEGTLKRSIELYNAMRSMRDAVDAIVQVNPKRIDLETTLDGLLAAAERPLKIASGFQLDQHWTLSVYVAEPDPEQGRMLLRCCAHARSVPCKKEEARKWPEGVGIGGICYATGAEVVIPDLADEDRGNQYQAASMTRPHDADRYRSLAAVPIVVEVGARPWGVIVASSDTPGHFRKFDPLGMHYIEAARALSTMVALVIAASYRSVCPPTPAATACSAPPECAING